MSDLNEIWIKQTDDYSLIGYELQFAVYGLVNENIPVITTIKVVYTFDGPRFVSFNDNGEPVSMQLPDINMADMQEDYEF